MILKWPGSGLNLRSCFIFRCNDELNGTTPINVYVHPDEKIRVELKIKIELMIRVNLINIALHSTQANNHRAGASQSLPVIFNPDPS